MKKLSDKQKAAVNKVSGEWGSRFISQKWDSVEQAGLDAAKAAGNVITTLSDEEIIKLKELLKPITDDWLAQATEAGHDGKALLEDYQSVVSSVK